MLSLSTYDGLCLFVQLLALGLQIHTNEGLERSQVKDIVNENCTNYITPQHNSFNFTTAAISFENNTQLNFVDDNSQAIGVGELMCPPWYQRKHDGKCEMGKGFKRIVTSEKRTRQIWLQTLYCMTTSEENATNRSDVIGSCLYSFVGHSLIYPLPCDISELNNYTCAGLNRKGQLCGRCVKGFAPPVYSYVLNCVNCTDYHLNWLKYIGVAFGPLTLFCILICIFHISATSAYLHGFIFFSQIITMPMILRMITSSHLYKDTHFRVGTCLYASLLSIWNLDMFRLFYEPFCIHPNMTVVQALALDYIIAFYPLVLLVITYGLVSLHSRNNRIVVTLWRPFRILLRPFLSNLNIETSLIESFATLYILSTLKVQSVTLDLLSPTPLYVDGSIDPKLYLYLAGNVEYFGPGHLRYAILALLLFTFFLFIPGLLLFLYPCSFFQRFLNKIHCNFLALRIFMDVFQGHYKDGTNNTRDYRFFSGIFFWTRFVLVASFVSLSSLYSFLAFGIIITMLLLTVAVVHPHRTKLHYKFDCICLVLLSLLHFSIVGGFLDPHNSTALHVSHALLSVSLTFPLLYITFLICFWIFKKKIPQKLIHIIVCMCKYLNSHKNQRLLYTSVQ